MDHKKLMKEYVYSESRSDVPKNPTVEMFEPLRKMCIYPSTIQEGQTRNICVYQRTHECIIFVNLDVSRFVKNFQ